MAATVPTPLLGRCPETPQTDPQKSLVNKLKNITQNFEQEMLSGKELMELLLQIPGMKELYAMQMDVGEGYTVEQHARMVLDIFEKEIAPLSTGKGERLFFDCNVYGGSSPNKPLFFFFLAIQNLGKGLNCAQGRIKDKDAELRTTRQLIKEKSEWLLYPGDLRDILILLKNDVMGTFLKAPLSDATVQTAMQEIRSVAQESHSQPKTLLNTLILLHQITASSYPVVRQACFRTDPDETVDANGIVLPRLVRNLEAETAVELLESAYSVDNQEKLRALRRLVILEPQDMLSGAQSFNAKDLLDVLSRSAEIRDAYAKGAGVGEGYSIREHTHMVLDVFIDELLTRSKTGEVLEACGLTSHAFAFFLALHDIGKGSAIEEIPVAGPERKQLELEKTLRLIHRHAEAWGISSYLPLFDALLSTDLMGDFLKSDGSLDQVRVCTDDLLESAYDAHIPPKAMLDLWILFHQCDASSYPFLRIRFFTSNPAETVRTGVVQQRALLGEGDTLYCPRNQDKLAHLRAHLESLAYSPDEWVEKVAGYPLADASSVTLANIETLILIRREWRFRMHLAGIDKKEHAPYLEFRSQFKKVLMEKFPTRLTQLGRVSDTRAINRTALEPAIKQDLIGKIWMRRKPFMRYLTSTLIQVAKPVEAKLRIAERFRVGHGGNSSALAMMLLSRVPSLQCTGDLMRAQIAPMSGELLRGVDPWGINNHSVSADTISGYSRLKRYTQTQGILRYNHARNLARFTTNLYPALVSDTVLWEYKFNSHFQALLGWRKEHEDDFQEKLGPHLRKICHAIQSELKVCDKESYSGKKRIENLKKLLQAFAPTVPDALLHDLPPVDLAAVQKRWLLPMALDTQADKLSATAIHLLQLRQWSEADFQMHIIPKMEAFIRCIEDERQMTLQPLIKVLKLLEHSFTDEEKTFLNKLETTPWSVLQKRERAVTASSSSAAAFPEGLQAYFSSLSELKKVMVCWTKIYSINKKSVTFSRTTYAGYSFDGMMKFIIQQKLLGREVNPKFLLLEIEKINRQFDFAKEILTMDQAKVQIPPEGIFRELIENPVPILFGSTKYMPQQDGTCSEYLFTEPNPLGAEGCDVLFTDTEASREKIRELLPEGVTVYLFNEAFEGIPFPLVHHPDHVRWQPGRRQYYVGGVFG